MITRQEARDITNAPKIQAARLMPQIEHQIRDACDKGELFTILTIPELHGSIESYLEPIPTKLHCEVMRILTSDDLGFNVDFGTYGTGYLPRGVNNHTEFLNYGILVKWD